MVEGEERGVNWEQGHIKKLDAGDEAGFGVSDAKSHPGGVERVAGVAVFVEEDEAARAFTTTIQELHSGLGGTVRIRTGRTKEITSGFGKHNFHDGFAVSRGRNRAGLGIGIAAAADQRGIADASGQLAAGAAGGRCSVQTALFIEGDRADGALFVAPMMLGGVRILPAALPGFVFRRGDEIHGITEGNALIKGELLRALANQHHVRAFFQHGASRLDRILDPAKSGDGAGTECGSVHHNGVAFHVAIQIQMRSIAGIEDRIVFENSNGGFERVERVASVQKDVVAGVQSAEATGFAGFDGVVGDIPGTAVNDERRAHFARIAEDSQ